MIFSADVLSAGRAALVEKIVRAALSAVDPQVAVRTVLALNGEEFQIGGQRFDLSSFQRVRLLGIGKACQAMARGVLEVLGDRVQDGLIIAKHIEDQNAGLPPTVRVMKGNHPVPGSDSLAAAQELAVFLKDTQPDDLVICLISGGGSALITLPQDPISLDDLQELTHLLLASGASINEMNVLRKHLDRVKGGGLARMANGAYITALILSDVIGSPLDVIASGPTTADLSTFEEALGVLDKYGLSERAPRQIVHVLRQGASGDLPETVKPGDPILSRVNNSIVASNRQAAEAAIAQASLEGFQTLLLTTYLQGEAAQVGTVLANILQQIDATGQPLARPACLIAGGETTVTLRGTGLGGRNQEMALGASFLLDGIPDLALVTLGTDGEDGPTDAAGAIVTGETLTRARLKGLDARAYLRNNDSYHFFEKIGALIRTGPTGTNVNDLALLFAF